MLFNIEQVNKKLKWLLHEVKCLRLSNTTDLEPKEISLGVLSFDTDVATTLVNELNSRASFSFAGHELPFFKFTIGNKNYIYTLDKKVRGEYGGGNVSLTVDDVQAISKPAGETREKVITVTLTDLGATTFDATIPQKIVDYAKANNIQREPETLHRWNVVEEGIFTEEFDEQFQ